MQVQRYKLTIHKRLFSSVRVTERLVWLQRLSGVCRQALRVWFFQIQKSEVASAWLSEPNTEQCSYVAQRIVSH